MKWSYDRKRLIEPGSKPTTIEVVKGEIILTGLNDAKSVVVEPLDGGGNPIKSMIIPVKKGTVQVKIGNDVPVWYFITGRR